MTKLEQLQARLEATEAKLRAARNNNGVEPGLQGQFWSSHEQVLTAIINAVPHPIFWKDQNFVFRGCNAAFAAEIGCSPNDIIGKTESDLAGKLLHSNFQQQDTPNAHGSYASPDSEPAQTIQDKTQKLEPVSRVPLRDPDGKTIGELGTFLHQTDLDLTENKLEQMHQRLLEYSRQSGMAEVATTVLHNVGNVLNSINVSSSLAIQTIRNSQVSELTRVVELLKEHEVDLDNYISNDTKGRQLTGYLNRLSRHLLDEQQEVIDELEFLDFNVEHVKEIISMQQAYALVTDVKDKADLREMADDALRMNLRALERHGIAIKRDYGLVPLVEVEKHKIMQILVNLMQNAKSALTQSERKDKLLTLLVGSDESQVRVSVIDNGIGIEQDWLPQLFDSGFTTKSGGLGLGLHSGALAAKEMGGSLTAFSDGPGEGAAFTLELPLFPGQKPDEV